MVRHIRLHRNELCPCRSGWLIVSCCLDPSDGKLRKKVKSIKPPGPATNYAHPNCYLRTTSDCSEEISREHYVSANILEQLGSDEGIEVFGLPWFNPGKGKRLSVDNLTSKILCKRHNENLSPLDHEAGIFFRELTAALSILDRKSSSKKSNFRLVSGAPSNCGCSKQRAACIFPLRLPKMANDWRRRIPSILKRSNARSLMVCGTIAPAFISPGKPARFSRSNPAYSLLP
jgi:hypothetical protein